ncbi:MAG: 4Fe-4S dicluster domain-containing protein [Candidatus Omnitrophica bacterium]|nr:4Fe-4S dicluster domain-containing protein [Candidatus Omnitrophota bacterium]
MIGTGVLKGMLVTLRQFVGSYPLGRWALERVGLSADGLFTIQYPETKQQHPERFRYFPFLVYDNTPDNLRCVACKICEQECPPQCIYIEQARDEQGRPIKAHGRSLPRTFNIDTSICMSCRICVDVCPFDAIEMDKEFELSSATRFDRPMVSRKEDLLRPNEYFQEIRPQEAAIVDARLAAKAKKPAPPPAAPPSGSSVPATQKPPQPSSASPS